ncbi:hypothetical protein K0M31_001908 [Melipona bicolor]|uniref:Uncharacterized protein n=1 Tax=Melipona bicolor TaxID=60889 RepID=A0AA40GGG9_9HYME|nr:hypothetical protein K0M31_001908 [Melipona bicolor]
MWGEMRRIKRRLEEQEKERKNKIVIRGLKVRNSETKRKVEEEFEIKGEVCTVETRGRKEVSNQTIVEMKDWETKQTVMQKKKKLGGKSIYLDQDLTEKERRVQRELGERAKEERAQGKEAKVRYRRIYIQGRCYVWNSEKKDRRGGFSEEAPQDKGITNKRKRRQRERKRDTQQEAVRTGKGIIG